jgi:RNA polymerase sigma factor (TIGR02999 family)
VTDITRILDSIEAGQPQAAEELLPIVYAELRRLAAQRLSAESPGHTLQPTALVHEAYLRLVGPGQRERSWNSRGHFFAAAADAMRRILIDNARRKNAGKRGGQWTQVTLDHIDAVATTAPDELLALDEALERLTEHDALAGKLVKLRYYAGLSVEQAAEAVGVSQATAYRHWSVGRAWLHSQLLKG